MKNNLLKNHDGIAHLMLILTVIVLAAVAGAGYLVYQKQADKKQVSQSQALEPVDAEDENAQDEPDVEPGSEESQPAPPATE